MISLEQFALPPWRLLAKLLVLSGHDPPFQTVGMVKIGSCLGATLHPSASIQAGSSMTAPLVAALRTIWAPRVWMLLVLAGLFTTGNWQLSFNQRESLLSVHPR